MKWPVVVVLLYFLPGFAVAFVRSARLFAAYGWSMLPFWAAAGLSLFLMRRFWSRSPVLLWLWTLEHESTHALFALLTVHPISDFRVGVDDGCVKYRGLDTWLIRISPYFFPLYLLVFLGVLGYRGHAREWAGQMALGVVFASTVLHVFHEFHPRQEDLKAVGKPFSWLFVPAANIGTWGLFLFYFLFGYHGLGLWWRTAFSGARIFWKSM